MKRRERRRAEEAARQQAALEASQQAARASQARPAPTLPDGTTAGASTPVASADTIVPTTPPGPGSVPATAPVPAPPAPVDRVDALTEAIGGELGRLRGEIRGRDADLVAALQQVAQSYDRVAARLDDERRVQALLAEALVRIERRLAAIEGRDQPGREELPRGPRVIGGTISPRPDGPRQELRQDLPHQDLPRQDLPRQDVPRRDA